MPWNNGTRGMDDRWRRLARSAAAVCPILARAGRWRPGRAGRWVLPPAAVAVSTALSLWLRQLIAPTPYLFFYPAIFVSALYGGVAPAALTAALSLVVANYLFVPVASAVPFAPERFFQAVVLLGVAALTGWLSGKATRAEALQAANADLERRRRETEEANVAARESRAQLQAAFQAMSDGAVVFDMAGRAILVNNAEARITGYAGAEEMQRDLDTFSQVFELADADGEPVPADQWPVSRVLRGESLPEWELRARRRDTGQEWFFSYSGEPVRDEAGRQILAVIITRDITERKRAEERLDFLAEASEPPVAAAMQDEEATLREIARNGTGLADYCIVDLLGEGGSFRRAAAHGAGGDPDAVEALARLSPSPDDVARYEAVRRVLQEGKSLLVPDLEASAELTAPDAPHLALGRSMGLRSLMVVPLDARGRVLGAMVLLSAKPGRVYDEEDLATAEIAARRAALALDNARLYREAREARAEAEEANQAKDQFVATVSHELRNPLNAITGGIHLLRASCPAEGRAGRALEIVERNTALQTRLINDLLDLSRLQRGKLQLQRAPTRLDRAVESAARSIEAEAKEAGLTLTCAVTPDLWVQGDADRLQQVVMNLLTNAVKFTPPPGEIRVECECVEDEGPATGDRPQAASEAAAPAAGPHTPTLPHSHTPIPPHSHTPTQGRCARVVVEDTGIGISRELLPGLFDAFRQGEVAGKGGKPGLGLGLSLVKGIVEQHGGRVWAESQGVGKGSRFIVELPLVEAPGLRAQAPGHAAPNPEPRTPGPIRVLVVEDNPDTRTLVADGLTLAGCDVRTAGTGEEGLAILREGEAPAEPLPILPEGEAPPAPPPPPGAAGASPSGWAPDVMLVDIGLPGMNGFEFLAQAHALPGMAGVPAFAVTGFGAVEDVRRGREAGFAGHFVKPVSVPLLLERIREWTGPTAA